MTWRAIVGLFALNLSFLVVGAALMWALRAWRYWTDLVRLAGVAYLVGLSALVAVLSMELVAGLRFTASSVALTGAVLTVGAVAIGVSRRVAAPSLRAPGWSVPRLTIPRAIALAAIALYVQALFRSSRLSGLSEWDAWWCWTLRAKALFYFEGLDSDLFGQGAPRCPGYPPGFSVVEAMGFHAMGSVDVVTLHLQYWFLAVGFLAAVLGLLAPRVSAEILLPCILLMLVMPSVTSRVTDGRADLPLAYLVVTGALLVVLWLDERNAWQLAVATILFGAALVTKREGVLLVAAVLLAAFVASWADRRSRWWPLVCAGVAAIGLSLAWRIWLLVEGQQSGGPEDGYLGVLDELDRAWPSLWLVLRTVVDYDFWLIAAVLAIVASGLAVLAGVTRAAVFTIAFACAAIAGCWWAIWSQPALPITQDFGANPVVRLVGGPILVLSALAPLLLQQAWDGRTRTINARTANGAGRTRGPQWWIACAIVLVAVAGYPASMLTGISELRLPGGTPAFPSVSECVRPVGGGPVSVVMGYTVSYQEAFALRARAERAGLAALRVGPDGCGRLRVSVDRVPRRTADDLVATALAAGLRPTMEGVGG